MLLVEVLVDDVELDDDELEVVLDEEVDVDVLLELVEEVLLEVVDELLVLRADLWWLKRCCSMCLKKMWCYLMYCWMRYC